MYKFFRKTSQIISLLAVLCFFCGSAAYSQDLVDKNNQIQSQTNFSINEEDFFDADFEMIGSNKDGEISDPFESFNRKVFVFNDVLDRYFLEHVAKAYRKSLPKIVRTSIRNFITNISLPISITNSLLQGKIDNSLATSSTFLINTTIGLGGLFDVATAKSMRYNKEDFGQTLAIYNFPSGPYIMLPFLGPSNLRDFSGWAITKAIDPVDLNLLKIGGDYSLIENSYRASLNITSIIDNRESLIEAINIVRKTSFDPYTTVKSAYIQRRNNEIKK